MQWTDIKIQDISVTTNKYHQPLYSSCSFCGTIKADKLLSRTSLMSDNTYHDIICRCCAKNWSE